MSTQTIAEESTSVQYNSAAGRWQVNGRSGRTWSWPQGPDGERQAQLYALEQDVPEVAAEVKAIIANAASVRHLMYDVEGITRRVIRAGFLIRDGKLLPPVPFEQYGGCFGELARVRGRKPEPYIITHDGENCFCDCADFRLEHAPLLPSGEQACKHIMAFLITETLRDGEPPADIDQPPDGDGPEGGQVVTCPQCNGRGRYTGVNQETNYVGLLRCTLCAGNGSTRLGREDLARLNGRLPALGPGLSPGQVGVLENNPHLIPRDMLPDGDMLVSDRDQEFGPYILTRDGAVQDIPYHYEQYHK